MQLLIIKKNITALCYIIILSFLYQDVAWTGEFLILDNVIPRYKNEAWIQSLIGNIKIPEDIGVIKEKSINNLSPTKTILHIQDSHANYPAQMNIAKILETLYLQGVDITPPFLIAVEGAERLVDVSSIRSFPYREAKEMVTDYLVRESLMTGAEFFLANSDMDKDVLIWGVEDKELYKENLEAFREMQGYKDEAKRVVKEMEEDLKRLMDHNLNEQQREFISRMMAYQRDEIGLEEYARFLKSKIQNPKSKIPNFKKLIRLVKLKQQIDFSEVEKERMRLIKDISKKYTKEEVIAVVTKGLNYQIGKTSAYEYFKFLKGYIREIKEDRNKRPKNWKSSGNSKDFQNLLLYIDYIHLNSSVDTRLLFREIADIERQIAWGMFDGGIYQKALIVTIIDKFINLKIYREDLEYYNSRKQDFITNNAIAPFLESFQRFCELGIRRDSILFNNTIKKMGETGIDTAILVTGGFHTEGIKELFKDKDISYAIISPRITKMQDKKRYIDLLMKEADPLEKILAFSGTRLALWSEYCARLYPERGEGTAENVPIMLMDIISPYLKKGFMIDPKSLRIVNGEIGEKAVFEFKIEKDGIEKYIKEEIPFGVVSYKEGGDGLGKKNPDSKRKTDSDFLKGLNYFTDGKYKEAIGCFRKIRYGSGVYSNALIYLILAERRKGNKGGEEKYKKKLKKYIEDRDMRGKFRSGATVVIESMRKKRDFIGVIDCCKMLLEVVSAKYEKMEEAGKEILSNNLMWIYEQMASSYEYLYEIDKAVKCLEKSVSYKREPGVLVKLSRLYKMVGRYEDSIRVTTEVKEKSSKNDLTSDVKIGLIYYNAGRYYKVIEIFEGVLNKIKKGGYILWEREEMLKGILAKCYLRVGEIDRVLNYAEELKGDRDRKGREMEQDIYILLINCYIESGEIELARDYYQELKKMWPRNKAVRLIGKKLYPEDDMPDEVSPPDIKLEKEIYGKKIILTREDFSRICSYHLITEENRKDVYSEGTGLKSYFPEGFTKEDILEIVKGMDMCFTSLLGEDVWPPNSYVCYYKGIRVRAKIIQGRIVDIIPTAGEGCNLYENGYKMSMNPYSILVQRSTIINKDSGRYLVPSVGNIIPMVFNNSVFKELDYVDREYLILRALLFGEIKDDLLTYMIKDEYIQGVIGSDRLCIYLDKEGYKIVHVDNNKKAQIDVRLLIIVNLAFAFMSILLLRPELFWIVLGLSPTLIGIVNTLGHFRNQIFIQIVNELSPILERIASNREIDFTKISAEDVQLLLSPHLRDKIRDWRIRVRRAGDGYAELYSEKYPGLTKKIKASEEEAPLDKLKKDIIAKEIEKNLPKGFIEVDADNFCDVLRLAGIDIDPNDEDLIRFKNLLREIINRRLSLEHQCYLATEYIMRLIELDEGYKLKYRPIVRMFPNRRIMGQDSMAIEDYFHVYPVITIAGEEFILDLSFGQYLNIKENKQLLISVLPLKCIRENECLRRIFFIYTSGYSNQGEFDDKVCRPLVTADPIMSFIKAGQIANHLYDDSQRDSVLKDILLNLMCQVYELLVKTAVVYGEESGDKGYPYLKMALDFYISAIVRQPENQELLNKLSNPIKGIWGKLKEEDKEEIMSGIDSGIKEKIEKILVVGKEQKKDPPKEEGASGNLCFPNEEELLKIMEIFKKLEDIRKTVDDAIDKVLSKEPLVKELWQDTYKEVLDYREKINQRAKTSPLESWDAESLSVRIHYFCEIMEIIMMTEELANLVVNYHVKKEGIYMEATGGPRTIAKSLTKSSIEIIEDITKMDSRFSLWLLEMLLNTKRFAKLVRLRLIGDIGFDYPLTKKYILEQLAITSKSYDAILKIFDQENQEGRLAVMDKKPSLMDLYKMARRKYEICATEVDGLIYLTRGFKNISVTIKGKKPVYHTHPFAENAPEHIFPSPTDFIYDKNKGEYGHIVSFWGILKFTGLDCSWGEYDFLKLKIIEKDGHKKYFKESLEFNLKGEKMEITLEFYPWKELFSNPDKILEFADFIGTPLDEEEHYGEKTKMDKKAEEVNRISELNVLIRMFIYNYQYSHLRKEVKEWLKELIDKYPEEAVGFLIPLLCSSDSSLVGIVKEELVAGAKSNSVILNLIVKNMHLVAKNLQGEEELINLFLEVGDESIAPLIKKLGEDNYDVMKITSEALSQLFFIADDKSADVIKNSLIKICKDNRKILERIVRRMDIPEGSRRKDEELIDMFVKIGDAAVGPLTRILGDDSERVVNIAKRAILEIDCIKKFVGYGLRVKDDAVVERVVAMLIEIGKKAVGPLTGVLRNESEEVCKRAVKTLVGIGGPAIESLVNVLRDKDEKVRAYAMDALNKICSKSDEYPIRACRELFRNGIRLFKVKEYEKALEYFIWAHEKNPADVMPIKYIILSLTYLGRDEDKEKHEERIRTFVGEGIENIKLFREAIIKAIGYLKQYDAEKSIIDEAEKLSAICVKNKSSGQEGKAEIITVIITAAAICTAVFYGIGSIWTIPLILVILLAVFGGDDKTGSIILDFLSGRDICELTVGLGWNKKNKNLSIVFPEFEKEDLPILDEIFVNDIPNKTGLTEFNVVSTGNEFADSYLLKRKGMLPLIKDWREKVRNSVTSIPQDKWQRMSGIRRVIKGRFALGDDDNVLKRFMQHIIDKGNLIYSQELLSPRSRGDIVFTGLVESPTGGYRYIFISFNVKGGIINFSWMFIVDTKEEVMARLLWEVMGFPSKVLNDKEVRATFIQLMKESKLYYSPERKKCILIEGKKNVWRINHAGKLEELKEIAPRRPKGYTEIEKITGDFYLLGNIPIYPSVKILKVPNDLVYRTRRTAKTSGSVRGELLIIVLFTIASIFLPVLLADCRLFGIAAICLVILFLIMGHTHYKQFISKHWNVKKLLEKAKEAQAIIEGTKKLAPFIFPARTKIILFGSIILIAILLFIPFELIAAVRIIRGLIMYVLILPILFAMRLFIIETVNIWRRPPYKTWSDIANALAKETNVLVDLLIGQKYPYGSFPRFIFRQVPFKNMFSGEPIDIVDRLLIGKNRSFYRQYYTHIWIKYLRWLNWHLWSREEPDGWTKEGVLRFTKFYHSVKKSDIYYTLYKAILLSAGEQKVVELIKEIKKSSDIFERIKNRLKKEKKVPPLESSEELFEKFFLKLEEVAHTDYPFTGEGVGIINKYRGSFEKKLTDLTQSIALIVRVLSEIEAQSRGAQTKKGIGKIFKWLWILSGLAALNISLISCGGNNDGEPGFAGVYALRVEEIGGVVPLDKIARGIISGLENRKEGPGKYYPEKELPQEGERGIPLMARLNNAQVVALFGMDMPIEDRIREIAKLYKAGTGTKIPTDTTISLREYYLKNKPAIQSVAPVIIDVTAIEEMGGKLKTIFDAFKTDGIQCGILPLVIETEKDKKAVGVLKEIGIEGFGNNIISGEITISAINEKINHFISGHKEITVENSYIITTKGHEDMLRKLLGEAAAVFVVGGEKYRIAKYNVSNLRELIEVGRALGITDIINIVKERLMEDGKDEESIDMMLKEALEGDPRRNTGEYSEKPEEYRRQKEITTQL